jgi:hypothetical protein
MSQPCKVCAQVNQKFLRYLEKNGPLQAFDAQSKFPRCVSGLEVVVAPGRVIIKAQREQLRDSGVYRT